METEQADPGRDIGLGVGEAAVVLTLRGGGLSKNSSEKRDENFYLNIYSKLFVCPSKDFQTIL